MDLKDILKIDINNLAQEQYKALKEHVIDKLNKIITLLNQDKLQEVLDLLEFSPEGDGWGQENYFINFSYDDDARDLENILSQMAKLKNIDLNYDN